MAEFKIHEQNPVLSTIAKFIVSLYPTAWDAYMGLNKLEEGGVAVVGWNGAGAVVGIYEDPYPDSRWGITFREKDDIFTVRLIFLEIDQTLLIDRSPLLDLLFEMGENE